jgi:hypothetical protein
MGNFAGNLQNRSEQLERQDLHDAPCDYLKLDLSGAD